MRPQKITFGEMRSGDGPTGILVYCTDYRCSHTIEMSAEQWPDDMRLSDIEPRFDCKACGKRGADVRRISSQRAWELAPDGRILECVAPRSFQIIDCLPSPSRDFEKL